MIELLLLMSVWIPLDDGYRTVEISFMDEIPQIQGFDENTLLGYYVYYQIVLKESTAFQRQLNSCVTPWDHEIFHAWGYMDHDEYPFYQCKGRI